MLLDALLHVANQLFAGGLLSCSLSIVYSTCSSTTDFCSWGAGGASGIARSLVLSLLKKCLQLSSSDSRGLSVLIHRQILELLLDSGDATLRWQGREQSVHYVRARLLLLKTLRSRWLGHLSRGLRRALHTEALRSGREAWTEWACILHKRRHRRLSG